MKHAPLALLAAAALGGALGSWTPPAEAWASASQPPASANSASSSAARIPSASLKSAFS